MAVTDIPSDTALKAARPRPKPYKVFDGGGLFLLVRPDGSKHWRLKYRFNGIEKLISFGSYPEVSLATARKRRHTAKQLLADGVNPSEQRKAAKALARAEHENTFESICREWFKKMSQKWASTNSEKVISRLERDVFPWVGRKPITKISGLDLLQLLTRVEARGAIESAHRIRQYINSTFQYAINTHRAVQNPTPATTALTIATRKHYASITDPKLVGGLLRAIRSYEGSPVTRTALQLAPMVFVRPGELRGAEWREISLEEGLR